MISKKRLVRQFEYKKVPISEISLYDENPRFDKSYSETEAIQKMIRDQGDKLLNLAEHIIDKGFNPTDLPILIRKSKKYFVKEGNRRIIALKLVENPNLIFDNETLKNKFLIIKSQKGHLAPKYIYCTVYFNEIDTEEWIKLKHTGKNEGVGVEKWNSEQFQRFGKKSVEELPLELQAIELLRENKNTTKATLNSLTQLKITNLGRLLTDPDIRIKIGLKHENGVLKFADPVNKSLKNLEKLVAVVDKPGFAVKSIYSKDDRKDLITKIKLNKIPFSPKSQILPKKKKEKKFPEPKYTSLINPSDNPPRKVPKKIISIFKELQVVPVDITPHAVGFLMRVLIELSVKNYLKGQHLHFDKYDSLLVKTQGGKIIEYKSLKEKINYINKHFISDNDLNKAVSTLNVNGFNLNLNQIVHNEKYMSTSTSVKDFWVNAEPLFNFLVK
ncbi:MAG TPA: hypothetical protein PKD79_00780 [Candidatus Doudnabacteria bacterium]|nr:hypothetical protein [Candidatus Doudnabacteria bacterium]